MRTSSRPGSVWRNAYSGCGSASTRSRGSCRSAATASAFATSRINGASWKGTSRPGRRPSSATASAPIAIARRWNPTSPDGAAHRVAMEGIQQARAIGVLGPAPCPLTGFILEKVLVGIARPADVVLRLEGAGAQDIGEQVRRHRMADRIGLGECAGRIIPGQLQEADVEVGVERQRRELLVGPDRHRQEEPY